jgi:hypothetical protein
MKKTTAASDDLLAQQISDWITSDGIHLSLPTCPPRI